MTKDAYYNNKKVSYMGMYPAIYFPSHYRASSSGMVYIHVLVAEKILGRELSSEEHVHHVDENKNNYKEDNIWVFATNTDHACYHEALKNNLDYSLFRVNGIYHCISGEYSTAKGLDATKQIRQNQPIAKSKLCPKCKAPISTSSMICRACRLKERNLNVPSKATLNQLIEALPFEEIGRMYGVTGKAVRKWCDKYGIRKETRCSVPKKEELTQLLLSNSRRKVAEHYSVNPSTVELWEKHYNLSFTSGFGVKCIETEKVFATKKEAAFAMYPNFNCKYAANNIAKICNTEDSFNGYHWISIPKTII